MLTACYEMFTPTYGSGGHLRPRYIVIKNGKVLLFQFSGTCLFLAWQISCVSVPMGQ